MTRLLIPGGRFVGLIGSRFMSGFTVTAIDPTEHRFLGLAHELPEVDNFRGGTIENCRVELGEEKLIPERTGEILGMVERVEPEGVSGLWYDTTGETVMTGKPHSGAAVLLNRALPGGEIRVDIVSGTGREWNFRVYDGVLVRGMSGSPILQDGKLVGALGWAHNNRRGIYRGRSIEPMADKLLGPEPSKAEREARDARRKAIRERRRRVIMRGNLR